MTNSPLELLISLSDEERTEALAGLTDEQCHALLYDWDTWARDSQREPPGDWRIWLLLAGRGYGKTRVGSEWVRKTVRGFEFVNIVGATADNARDIMIEGESGILAVCPANERPVYRKTLRRLDWPNGAKSLIFTADEPERIRGHQHQRVWADELASWQYADEAWTQITLGLRLPPDPRALVTTTPKAIETVVQLVESPECVVVKGTTYENRDNLATAFFDELIGKFEGTRLGRQELEAELLLDEGLAYFFSEQIHVIDPLKPLDSWDRFESMDFGSSNPTAWLWWAVDYDGNLVIFDEFYNPGLPSETAPEILARRNKWQPANTDAATTYADPTVWDSKSVTNKWGQPATVADEFMEHNIRLLRANRSRVTGYVRVAELLKLREDRVRPAWAGTCEQPGSPSLFVTRNCQNVIHQLRYAPVEEEDEPHPGEAVSRRWETTRGHAHAAVRYGALSWPGPSVRPVVEPSDPRVALLQRVERKRDQARMGAGRYVDV